MILITTANIFLALVVFTAIIGLLPWSIWAFRLPVIRIRMSRASPQGFAARRAPAAVLRTGSATRA
jgi:hypothetical protein